MAHAPEKMSPGKVDKIPIELLLEYAASLPASPRIFARLSSLVQNEDSALDYISSLVKQDPGLAAQILRVTNSAYYGAAMKVNDLETAIGRIGFLEVQKILSMIVARECFYQALPTYGLSATDFAEQCVAVAVASETLAKRVGMSIDRPYIAGLLHLIGMLAIDLYLQRLEQSCDLKPLAAARPLEDVEQEIFGLTRWRAGYELLRHWQFEPAIWHPIKNQIDPERSVNHLRETAILTLAIWTCQQLTGYNADAELPGRVKWSLKRLGIDALDIARSIDEARFEINDRRNLLFLLL